MEVSQLSNLRHAYEELERRVQRALNTQVGDSERLEGVQEVLLYIQAVEQVFGNEYVDNTSVYHSTRTSSRLKSFRFAAAMHSP